MDEKVLFPKEFQGVQGATPEQQAAYEKLVTIALEQAAAGRERLLGFIRHELKEPMENRNWELLAFAAMIDV